MGGTPASWATPTSYGLLQQALLVGGDDGGGGGGEVEGGGGPEGVLITGLVGRDGGVTLDPLLFEVGPCANPEGTAITVELRSAVGAVLSSSRFDPDFRLEVFDEESAAAIVETDVAAFRLCMDFPPGTAEVAVLRNAAVVARLAKSANAPEVAVEAADLRGEQLSVAWSATDKDGDALSATVSLIRNGARTSVVAIDLEEEAFTIALEKAVDPAGLEVEVVVSDGFLTGSDRAALGPRVGGSQVPGDCNIDGDLDISDAVCMFGFLFLGSPTRLPCGDGTGEHPANLALLDWGEDRRIDITDGIQTLQFIFLSGQPHPLARAGRCAVVNGCGDGPSCP